MAFLIKMQYIANENKVTQRKISKKISILTTILKHVTLYPTWVNLNYM